MLLFADDIALFNDLASLQNQLGAVTTYSFKWRLKLNVHTTKI